MKIGKLNKGISKPARKQYPTEEKVALESGSQSNCTEKRCRIGPSSMIYAASMPALNLHEDLLQNKARQATGTSLIACMLVVSLGIICTRSSSAINWGNAVL